MLFKKRSPKNMGRNRPPARTERTGVQPVFSYHARSARTEPSSARKTSRLLWVNASSDKQQEAGRRPSSPRNWPRRALVVSGAVLGAALVVSSVLISRDPLVIPLADTSGRQALLRSQEAYQEAANAIFSSSLANTTKITVDTAKVSAAMKKQFPELKEVSVTLPLFGRRPIVYLQPSEPALVFKTRGEMFILDDNGQAVADATRAAGVKKLALPVVQDQSGLSLAAGQRALPRDSVAFITEVTAQLRAKKLVITDLVLPQGASELDVRVKGAKYIAKFNLRGDARAEAGAFLAVRQYLARHKKTPESYVDLRVDNRAYYK
jgi:cell division septal protein FtsQ